MRLSISRLKDKSIFWGWYVVFGAFILLFFTYGVRYSFGVFVQPMSAEYNWSMTVIQLGASINLIVYALSCVLFGWLLDRFTARWIMTGGILAASAGLILAAQITSPSSLYISYGILVGAGTAGCGMVVNGVTVTKWFTRYKGLALGLSSMGIGFGTMLIPPVAGYLVKSFGWRNAFLAAGVLMLVVGIFIRFIFMGKNGPEQLGLMADGDKMECKTPSAEIPVKPSGRSSIQPVLTRVPFWLLAFCNICAVMTVMMAFNCQIPYAINQGIDPLEAAAALGLIGITGSLGKLFFGWFCDHIKDAKYSAAAGFLIMAVGMFFLYRAENLTLLYTFALIFGFGYGSIAPVMPYLLSNIVENRVFGSAYGLLVSFATGIGGSIGPVLGGYIFDRNGSYKLGWLISIAALVIAALIVLALRSTPAVLCGRSDE
jgi:sugar phosphate permease